MVKKGEELNELSKDVVLLKFESLSNEIKAYATENAKIWNNVGGKLNDIQEKVNELNVKVGIQNGRVTKLETLREMDHINLTRILVSQENSPTDELKEELRIFKEDMMPIHMVSKNWKLMLLTVLALGMGISLIPKLAVFLWGALSSLFEIGV